MAANSWTKEELAELAETPSLEEFRRRHPHRSPASIRSQRDRLRRKGVATVWQSAPPVRTDEIALARERMRAQADRNLGMDGRTPSGIVTNDKKIGKLNWRDANKVIGTMQELRTNAGWSQHHARINVETEHQVAVIFLSDAHILSWGTDHELFEKVTDEILSIPNLHIVLMGDMAQMAIKLRSVMEVSDNMLPPEIQDMYLESWLEEMFDRILAACWGNHDVERSESQAGSSVMKNLYNRRFVYTNGIGHIDLTVGKQTYKLAVSHHFLGRSIYSPVHGAQRYLMLQGHDREIAACGDSHVPGVLSFTVADRLKLAVNAGTFQTNSGYAKRYFSLFTHPVFPVVVFDPDEHLFTPYWSISHWLRASGEQSAQKEAA